MNPNPELVAQNNQFQKQVIELAPDVYGAIGFAASNVYMLVGEDGLLIIDTTETTKAAENILAEFRKVTDKPVKTILYTHTLTEIILVVPLYLLKAAHRRSLPLTILSLTWLMSTARTRHLTRR